MGNYIPIRSIIKLSFLVTCTIEKVYFSVHVQTVLEKKYPPACAFKLKRCLVRFGDCPGISLVSDQGKEIQTAEPLCFHPAPPSHLPFRPPHTNTGVQKGPR